MLSSVFLLFHVKRTSNILNLFLRCGQNGQVFAEIKVFRSVSFFIEFEPDIIVRLFLNFGSF